MKKLFSVAVGLAVFLLPINVNAIITYPETVTAVVQIYVQDSLGNYYSGSGFFISKDGLILTNNHVIWDTTLNAPASIITICTIQNEYSVPNCMYSGEVIAYDDVFDMAIIAPAYELDIDGYETGEYLGTIEDLGLPYVDLADYNPSIGDDLTIFGFPQASNSLTITLTKGIVSGFETLASVLPEEGGNWVWKIKTDATVNPGNSGGPAYNYDERVIGIVTEITTEGIGGNYAYIISNDIVYLWFWNLVDAGVLNQAYVEEVFSNDYQEEDSNENIDWSNVQDSVESVSTGTFTDVTGIHPNAPAIEFLYYSEIISGYPDGSFKPNGEVNRAELMKMVVEMIFGTPDDETYKNCFPDVKTEWFAKYVCYAKEQGWVSGYPDGTFRPANNTNRAEAIKIILNATYGGETSIPTPDQDKLASTQMPIDIDQNAWYIKHLTYAITEALLDMQHQTINANGDYKYYVDKNMTRKEVAEMIYRLLVI